MKSFKSFWTYSGDDNKLSLIRKPVSASSMKPSQWLSKQPNCPRSPKSLSTFCWQTFKSKHWQHYFVTSLNVTSFKSSSVVQSRRRDSTNVTIDPEPAASNDVILDKVQSEHKRCFISRFLRIIYHFLRFNSSNSHQWAKKQTIKKYESLIVLVTS